MSNNSIPDYSETPADNEDVGGIDIRGTAKASGMRLALQTLLSQLKKTSTGTTIVEDTWSFADPANLTKRVRLDAGNVTAGQTRIITAPDYNLDLAKVPNVSAAQSFTEGEKAQVLTNVGAATPWVAYTPVFTGFGTVSNVTARSRRVGSNLEVIGRFTSGTSTAVTAVITLGFNGTSGNVTVASWLSTDTFVVGNVTVGFVTAASYYAITIGGQTTFNVGMQRSDASALAKANGNVVGASGQGVAFQLSVPIDGW